MDPIVRRRWPRWHEAATGEEHQNSEDLRCEYPAGEGLGVLLSATQAEDGGLG